MTTVAIIQARTGSTRLPRKTLLDLAGEPMLARVMARTSRAKSLDKIIVATTTEPSDDALIELCNRYGWQSFRGSENDVLDRYHGAAVRCGADTIVRITSDCPMIDPEVIDLAVDEYERRQPDCDYVSNTEAPHPFPRGLDVEVVRAASLELAWRDAVAQPEREHVTLHIYRNPQKFHVAVLSADRDYSDVRWTVDTAEDRELVVKIFEHFGHDRFTWREALELVEAHPEWQAINKHIRQKQV